MKIILCILLSAATSAAATQTCVDVSKRNAPNDRYEILSSGWEVLDKKTDLVWQRCSIGQTWSGTTCMGYPADYDWQNALKAATSAGGDWYLPNKRELESLVEWGCHFPAINADIFPTVTDWFWWSSSVSVDGAAYGVHFLSGGDTRYRKGDYMYSKGNVRLVRARQ